MTTSQPPQNTYEAKILFDAITPADVRNLDQSELPLLAEDIRQRIIATVSKNGGHLAPNLGVIELTLALLKLYDPA